MDDDFHKFIRKVTDYLMDILTGHESYLRTLPLWFTVRRRTLNTFVTSYICSIRWFHKFLVDSFKPCEFFRIRCTNHIAINWDIYIFHYKAFNWISFSCIIFFTKQKGVGFPYFMLECFISGR